jgi:hypothetical protein
VGYQGVWAALIKTETASQLQMHCLAQNASTYQCMYAPESQSCVHFADTCRKKLPVLLRRTAPVKLLAPAGEQHTPSVAETNHSSFGPAENSTARCKLLKSMLPKHKCHPKHFRSSQSTSKTPKTSQHHQ